MMQQTAEAVVDSSIHYFENMSLSGLTGGINAGSASIASSSTSSKNQYFVSFLASISIIGTVGNLLVTIVYWRKKDKQTSTFFILVLAMSDLAVCLLLVPMTIYMESVEFITDSAVLCKFYYFITTTTVPSSSLIMSAIAFDRYFCICMVNRVIMTLNRAKLLVTLLLLLSLLLGIIPAMSSVILINSNATLNQTIPVCIIDPDSKYTQLGFLIWPFKFFYDLIYAGSVIIITVLYILIYKEIYVRRRIKRNRKKELLKNGCLVLPPAAMTALDGCPVTTATENQIAEVRNNTISLSPNPPPTPVPPMNNRARRVSSMSNNEPDGIINIESDNMLQPPISDSIKLNRGRPSLKMCYCYVEKKDEEGAIYLLDIQKLTEQEQLEEKNRRGSRCVDEKNKRQMSASSASLHKAASITPRPSTVVATKACQRFRWGTKASGDLGIKAFRSKSQQQQQQRLFRRDSTINSRIIPFLILIKETRTAFMLFVISIAFIASYLPSILATRSLLPNDNLYIVYLYLTNSALNPIIYSFMNRSFRSDLRKLFVNKAKPVFSASRFSSLNAFSITPNKYELKTF